MSPSVGSVCSGVGGMDLGFKRAGYETRWVCEIDPWRRQILAEHFPDAKQYSDLATLDPVELEPVDVLIGGTPCQDLSNAGKQAGLEGSRSRLFFDFIRIRNSLGVPWSVWENVTGALSSNRGVDFACVLGAFVGAPVAVPEGGWPSAGVACGPWGGCVWRVLNAQYFGVPQRRRRVFVVGHLGGECSPEVLFESASGARDLATRGEARSGVAGSVADGASTARCLTAGGGRRLDHETEDFVVSSEPRERESSRIVGYAARRAGRQLGSGGAPYPDVVSTLQGGGERGYRIDAEGAAGGQLIIDGNSPKPPRS